MVLAYYISIGRLINMQYGYSIRILEDGAEVITHTKKGKECTVRITKTDKWVDKDKGVTKVQVKYTEDFANQIFSNQWGRILTFP